MNDPGRRRFLKLASLGVLGVAAGELLEPVDADALEPPRPGGGRRWAMCLDVAACLRERGCTRCIDACHRTHNVPAIPEPRQAVKWLWRERFPAAFPDQEAEHVAEAITGEQVLVTCNHCANPPCARVCPTEATWRRQDGIVMMDWHRCIGCRYCVAACPYGARSFNFVDPRKHLATVDPSFPTRTTGVVEKCTLCSERIDRGGVPACVEACPDRARALMFGDLNDAGSPVRLALRGRYALRRKSGLGTQPSVYYLV